MAAYARSEMPSAFEKIILPFRDKSLSEATDYIFF